METVLRSRNGAGYRPTKSMVAARSMLATQTDGRISRKWDQAGLAGPKNALAIKRKMYVAVSATPITQNTPMMG